ncbi:unnamed protein product [Sphagnum jensenii]|uniref:Uncharacterized protein n=1 Tax=Sphagnum jensenii TaxID=128206 RepID=A0ABP0WY60_9BRYO
MSTLKSFQSWNWLSKNPFCLIGEQRDHLRSSASLRPLSFLHSKNLSKPGTRRNIGELVCKEQLNHMTSCHALTVVASAAAAAPARTTLVAPSLSPNSERIDQLFRDQNYATELGSKDLAIALEIPAQYERRSTPPAITSTTPTGLCEATVRLISAAHEEPDWLLQFRLEAFAQWQKMREPTWSDTQHPPINFQDIPFYSRSPDHEEQEESRDNLFEEDALQHQQLGSTDFRPVSIANTQGEALEQAGVIFCTIFEAVHKYPELVKQYLGKVVPSSDNYYAALNAAVFSDGSFCYVPRDTICPMEVANLLKINEMKIGQFERTLIVADEGSFVSYMAGCTAPTYDDNQLHVSVVELHCAKAAEIKYSTVQNWASCRSSVEDDDSSETAAAPEGIHNFVIKRGLCEGERSKITWTQVELGAAITWKYPSVVLKGDNSVAEFYSVVLTKDKQQAETGAKMIHVGKNTRSRIVAKGIAGDSSLNCYRGLVEVQSSAHDARNFSRCDSILIGDEARSNTYPYIEVKDPTARVQHEASTSKIGKDQIFYFQQRGIDCAKAVSTLMGAFCCEVFEELPLELASEVNQLMRSKLAD